MKRLNTSILALAALAVIAAGCASAEPLVRDARATLDDARSAHADYLAPYEFAMAEYFLDEAASRNSASDAVRASQYARESMEWAERAKVAAKSRVQHRTREEGNGR